MDTLGLLGQALECSVCLEQLDTTSRVLPCQHTFCRKCLVDIINTRKELRCPECRDLVTVPFNSLPPNILLLRILEGMKNIPTNTSSSIDKSDPSISNFQSQLATDPFSIFSQVIEHSGCNVQTSNVPVRNDEVSSQAISKNPFLLPNLNLYTNIDNDRSITTTQNVLNTTDEGEHSSVAEINYQSTDILSRTAHPSNSNTVNEEVNGGESIFSLSSSNQNKLISCVGILSSVPQAQLRSDISLSANNRDTEPMHNEMNMLSTLQPTILTSELNNLSNTNTIPNSSRMLSSNLQIEPSTSGSSNNRGNESQISESTASVNVSKWEESLLLNVRSNIVRQLSTKSLGESQLSGVSCQPYIPPLNMQALALYNYNGKEVRDLRFKKGDIITIKKQIDENWYQGELNGHVGIVPSSYIKFIDSPSSHIPQCKALYDFKMVSEEERNCLMFCKGDTITILRRIDENWAEGKLNTHIGIFPFSFVELNEAAKKLLRLSESAPSSTATPTTTGPNSSANNLSSSLLTVSSNISAPICSILSPVSVHTTSPQQQVQTLTTSDSASLTNQHCLTNNQSCPSLSSWASQSTNRISGVLASTNISALSSNSLAASERNKSSDVTRLQDEKGISISLATLENLQLYIALYSYRPRKADELELKKGFLYSVADKCQDGWFKGRCLSSDKIGVFPGNYVQLADAQAISSSLSPRYSSMNIANYISDIRGFNKSKWLSSPKTQSQTGSLGDVRNLNNGVACPPELPPRSITSSSKNSSIFSHSQNSTLERPASASEISTRVSSCPSPISHQGEKKSNSKVRNAVNGGGISLMRSFKTSGKRTTKSPPLLSLDNPVFEDSNVNRTKNVVACEDEMKSSNTISKSLKQPAPLVKERYRCIVPYPANSIYELELQLGDIVYVYKKNEDGWFKGTHQRTGKTGLFPSIFVESY